MTIFTATRYATADVISCGFRMFPESLDLWELQKSSIILSYISFKIVPLCNSTLMPATVLLLETFLETILWKHFQLFLRILNDVISITQSSAPSVLTQSMEQAEISWSQVWSVWGMLQCCRIVYVCMYRFQNVVLRCPTPRLHCFLFSHWHSFRFLSFVAFGFKTSFYVVRHLDSTASYFPTGIHLDFFRSWPSVSKPRTTLSDT